MTNEEILALVKQAGLSHLNDGEGWRKSIAAWAAPLLDPYDPSGKHL